jgi:hypothetical protein
VADLLVAWVAFPALGLAVCAGCGLLVAAASGDRIDGPLLPGVGYALVVVAGQFLAASDATAGLATPVVATLAAIGIALGLRAGRRRVEPWALAAAVATFAVFAAPIVLSGSATIAGFIKLDDTATWLAFTDRVIDHGRDLGGLAPSTYEATLDLNIGEGYPIGAFVPLGVGSKLLATDPAWLIQPYMAGLGALVSLALWSLATPLAGSPRLRAGAALVGAVPALLFGYYLWGGVKEVAAAALLASIAALAVRAVAEPRSVARLAAPTLAAAALVAVLSAGAVLWLAPLLIPAAVLLVLRAGPIRGALRAAGVAAAVAALALPTLLAGGLRPPTSSPLDDSSALGNLARPLDPFQLAGIWGSGDFRFDPGDDLATDALIAIALIAAAAGVLWGLRRREPGPPLFVLGMLAGAAVIAALGSPWVEGKAYATASVAIPFAAMLGVGWLAASGRGAAAVAVGVAVAGGVAWSNALAFRDASLAPRDQLAELERISEQIAGQGPTLITEYSPYGARHFLRDADPESISELRRRPILLRDGGEVPKGRAADTDRIDPSALNLYRTLVVRRSPAASRPPAQYRLTWSGDYYQAWQRAPGAPPPVDDLPLGDRHDPVAVPSCAAVRRLAARAPADARLVASTFPAPVTSRGDPEDLERTIEIERGGEYELWLEGSAMPELVTRVDGARVGSVRGQVQNRGAYVRLGSARLDPGPHRIEVEVEGADLHPGSDLPVQTTGVIALSRGEAADARLVSVGPGRANSLCGGPWDWIEVVRR